MTLQKDGSCLCVGDWDSSKEVCTACPADKYYEPKKPGCQRCKAQYVPNKLDDYKCDYCEGRVEKDFFTCTPCKDYEIWDDEKEICKECKGVIDGTDCNPCYDKDTDDELKYYNKDDHECQVCVGEIDASDVTVCTPCATNKYFYENQQECVDCIGTVSSDYKTCTKCDKAGKNEYFGAKSDTENACKVCYGPVTDATTCALCDEGSDEEYVDSTWACKKCSTLTTNCKDCDLKTGACTECDTNYGLDSTKKCVACKSETEWYATTTHKCLACDKDADATDD